MDIFTRNNYPEHKNVYWLVLNWNNCNLWSQTDACKICYFDPYDGYYGLVSPGKVFYNHISWYFIDIQCLEPLEPPNNQFLEIYAFCTNSKLLWQILKTFWLCLLISAPLEENRQILLAPMSIYVWGYRIYKLLELFLLKI